MPQLCLQHPSKNGSGGGNANGLLACPFRLEDNNAKAEESETNEYDCGKNMTLVVSCLFNVTVRKRLGVEWYFLSYLDNR